MKENIKLDKPKSYYLKRSQEISMQEKKWEIEKQNIERENKIKAEQNELKQKNPYKLTMSKKMLIFLFINCTIIELFTGFIELRSIALTEKMIAITGSASVAPDFTPLVALIGAVIGEVIGLAAYFVKSTKENTKGGITFEAAAAENFKGTAEYDDELVEGLNPSDEKTKTGGQG